MKTNVEQIVHKYLDAKTYVLNSGYSREIDWQKSISFEQVTESDFLREIAWVIISSGFKESIVRKIFPGLSKSFLYWNNAQNILLSISECKTQALKIFKNTKKIDAICSIIESVASIGFLEVKQKILKDGIDYVIGFPFIGHITGFHLLKNLGVNVAKPDRHLVRISQVIGYTSVQDMCSEISNMTGDSIAVVDLVLWRYATLKKDYINTFVLKNYNTLNLNNEVKE